MNNEVYVLPDVVIIHRVELKALLCVPVERLPANTTDEANILAVLVSLSLLVSQLCERINNDTEDDIKKNCDDEQEEGQIVGRAEVETLLVLSCCCLRWKELTNTATTTKTVVNC